MKKVITLVLIAFSSAALAAGVRLGLELYLHHLRAENTPPPPALEGRLPVEADWRDRVFKSEEIATANADYDAGQYVLAVRKFRDLAERGDLRAQHNLANMYTRGEGVPRNQAIAMKWYQSAATAGNAHSAFNIAAMHERAQGALSPKVKYWLKVAADLGDTEAQALYALRFAQYDNPTEFIWYLRAAAGQGNVYARYMLIDRGDRQYRGVLSLIDSVCVIMRVLWRDQNPLVCD